MEQPLTQHIRPNREPLWIEEYERVGGYASVRTALGKMSPADVQKMVTDSKLRGRGGAGFPTSKKWSFVPMGDDAPHPKFLVNNADEMEPSTFKDRLLLEGSPHQVIESMIVSAYAIQADVAYIFLRLAYKTAARHLERALAEACRRGYLGKNILGSGWSLEMHLHVSAGRYMCGEETGLLNSLEGKRATPRSKPPYPQLCGLWGQPTIVNNTETLCNVMHIVNRGAEWFQKLSRSGDGGTKLYGVSGRVKRPGLWELPLGATLREVFEERAGGMRDGFQFRGIIPGGASTDFLVAEHFDTKLDYDSVQQAGSRLGTGNMIVLDDRTCPVAMVANMEQFFAQESCGWCTPCREGLPWIAETLKAIEEGRGNPGDLEMLERHCKWLGPGHTFCALAPGAMEPLQSALKYFRADFEQHVREKRCPWRNSQ
jgi:NADH-quinone oxidoreductase subunit F